MTALPRWTPEQDAMLKGLHGLPDADLAVKVSEIGPERTIQAVKHRRQWILLYKSNPVSPGPWGEKGVLDRMIALHAAGDSASQIARVLNGEFRLTLTRNAVIGKIHRMKLEKPERALITQTLGAAPRRIRAASRPKPSRNFQHGGGCVVDMIPKDARPVRALGPLPTSRNLPMWDKDFGGCRYPTSADDAPEITFCCLPADGSYCPNHLAACCAPVPASGPKSAKELARSLRRYVAA